MAQRFGNLLSGLKHKRVLNQWERVTENAPHLGLNDLKDVARQARTLKGKLDTLLRVADTRLDQPDPDRYAIAMPDQCDWAWRPDPWRCVMEPKAIVGVQNGSEIGSGLKVFHDCALGEISLRQHRNLSKSAMAPYGVALDVLGFEGSFLSAVFDLPEDGRNSTTRRHIVCLSGEISFETPVEVFARLNVKHGPNVEQFVSEIVAHDGKFNAEFDIGHAAVNERRLENIWLDLIFDKPQMNRILINDLTFARRPRAEL